MTTFFASVLNRSPTGWTTVIVTYPVLLVLTSLTVPDLPSWTPPITLHLAPSLRLRVDLAIIARRLGNQRVPVNALMVARGEFSEFFRIGMSGS